MSSTPQIEARAAEWLARQQGNWRDEDNQALESWLAGSTAHRVAYLRLNAAWTRADRLAALRTPSDPASGIEPPKPITNVLRRDAAARIAAVFVLLAVGIGALIYALPKAERSSSAAFEYQTQVGGHKVVALADGSTVELNTDTRVRAKVTASARTVWLEQGEAFFDVVHDTNHPFTVVAGPRRITVLGTRFSVRRDDGDVQVKVLEGKVRIESAEQPVDKPPAIVTRGEFVVAKKDSTLIAQRAPQEIENDLEWRHGVLVINHWTLADAAREFNRYNDKKLVVAESVADLRLGGRFEAGNVEAFARLLHDALGLRVQAGADEITITE